MGAEARDGGGTLDAGLWGAILACAAIRFVPQILWPEVDCTRDECIYQMMANGIVDGEGLTVSRKGWLTAPGYPYLLAVCIQWLGAIEQVKKVQVAMAVVTTWALYRVGTRFSNRTTGVAAAWLYALHPTFVFYAGTMWTETAYTMLLSLSVLSLLWAREGDPLRALVPGAFIGSCVLFRGAATYLAPVWVLAALWPAERQGKLLSDLVRSARSRWQHAAAFALAVFLVVAPYSWRASKRHGGFMISDATVGHVLYLGNNDFEPLTFDYGNGMLTGTLYARYLQEGRRACSRRVPPVQSSKCEVLHALKWMTENPVEFVSRIPVRNAQMLNPNTFFTRQLRWGYYEGLPWLAKEVAVLWILLTSYAIIVWGTVCACARAKGPFGVMAVGTVVYHMGLISAMYGMSRFRLPLESLWIVFLAAFIAEPRETLQMLKASPARTAAAGVLAVVLFGLTSWYAGTAYPGLWR